MQTSYLLGVDGGGTSCRVRLCDSKGHTLGEGQSGSANAMLGVELTFQSINTALQQALDAANLSSDILNHTRAGLGLAGAISAEVRSAILDYAHPFMDVRLQTDAHIACLGAHSGEEGAILITGTGSCGLLYREGNYYNVGGWGFPVSDQGSGARLGLRSIQYSLQAYDGLKAQSDFTKALMDQFNNSPLSVSEWMASAAPKDYAALAPLIIEFDARHDGIAKMLLQETADEASQILLRLAELGADKICLMGGLSDVLKEKLAQEAAALLVEPKGDALDGAIHLAQQGKI